MTVKTTKMITTKNVNKTEHSRDPMLFEKNNDWIEHIIDKTSNKQW